MICSLSGIRMAEERLAIQALEKILQESKMKMAKQATPAGAAPKK